MEEQIFTIIWVESVKNIFSETNQLKWYKTINYAACIKYIFYDDNFKVGFNSFVKKRSSWNITRFSPNLKCFYLTNSICLISMMKHDIFLS
jgi:hypothetical protein